MTDFKKAFSGLNKTKSNELNTIINTVTTDTELTTVLADYEKTADLTTLLEGYVLDTDLASYAKIVTVPASASAAGTAGQIAYDATHIYVCVATNTWVRATLATWT